MSGIWTASIVVIILTSAQVIVCWYGVIRRKLISIWAIYLGVFILTIGVFDFILRQSIWTIVIIVLQMLTLACLIYARKLYASTQKKEEPNGDAEKDEDQPTD